MHSIAQQVSISGVMQDAINSAPEDQRPRVLISTSAVGEPLVKYLFVVSTLSLRVPGNMVQALSVCLHK